MSMSADELAVLITPEIAPAGVEPYSAEWQYWRGFTLKVIKAVRRHESKARAEKKRYHAQYFVFDDASKELVPMPTEWREGKMRP